MQNQLANRLTQIRLAIGFLSRLPVGRFSTAPGALPPLGATLWAFPLAGALIALLPAAIFALFYDLATPWLAGLLATGLFMAVTGALHEDGLADTADGFGGGKTTEAKLDIMHDSRIGSYGVLALIIITGLRIAGPAAAPDAETGVYALICLAAASRAPMVWMLYAQPNARADGLASAISIGRNTVAFAALTALIALLMLPATWLLILVLLAVTVGFSLLSGQQIKGRTGDTLGASQQLCEASLWVVLASIWAA
ncbi:adenosylcobinamide-GDP ribazoletransferase [Aureimonas fodinaquatilis]|uniref:Adenosylcobinamide-GDP ribazoletransferase n=1 Tax=Aureimonas fodinaquatilis TaxID=2565783 RepID=A0A5B0DUE3_9HYPH|nr:adenosylcobinamide-GDP ribazoletransferase [Aureimonas fodinaquatilis]KAA0969555.1 adenosylcobinamide-GDP ribazoletransferase [Aureimonas fodinaquatilis]